ncbi:LuxR C-terminal-related transcriptional regulator [Cypionkella sinensis]|uniref:LuxR C-terminal-related transcriptional regulator n=1 Tax=Cypionkella sinensis TaxID=1756043 RepID=A0ABV7IVL2_9RHOB
MPTDRPSGSTALLARNAVLQSALSEQLVKAADLRSILCSLGLATVSVSRDLKLRLFTTAAGRLLGICAEQIGTIFALEAHPPIGAFLLDRIRAVLGNGIAESHLLPLASGPNLLCRLLPLRAFEAADPTVDGVVLTFAPINPAPADVASILPAEVIRPPETTADDGGLAAGYPGLGFGLTHRQHQVLGHVLAGHPSKNIAADLGISQRTVENHRAAIMARTGATSLPALARLAIGADVGGDCKPALTRRAAG